MTYNNNTNNNGYSNGFGASGASFGNRSRFGAKRLSVALPPKVNPISENQVDNPTPRTSRSHMLAGLRTQPRTPQGPASAPFSQTQYRMSGLGGAASKRNDAGYDAYDQGLPQSATGAGYDLQNQYAMNAGQQVYTLPEQPLAPPMMYDQGEEMDPAMLQEMQLHSLYLAQRQQQLQQQLASLTASAQGLNLNTNFARNPYQQNPMTPQTPQNLYGNNLNVQETGQPGVYLVFNPATQAYSYVIDQNAQQQAAMSPVHQQQQANFYQQQSFQPPTPTVSVTPPANDMTNPLSGGRSFSPPKHTPSPPTAVEPLPPPSSNAFRRSGPGHAHKKTASLSIQTPIDAYSTGPKTSSTATFGSARTPVPAGPMTGTGTFFGPGAARAGEHPVRQPRGPPAIDELMTLPTALHEGSKNFATRQRRRALDSLVKAGSSRRGASRSGESSGSGSGSPVSERELTFPATEDAEIRGVRKMSPIGSEMQSKAKRGSAGSQGSAGSDGGYFGLSSASSSSSEGEEGVFKLPPTPLTPGGSAFGSDGGRKKLMLGVLNAAEKRRSFIA